MLTVQLYEDDYHEYECRYRYLLKGGLFAGTKFNT
eukprot:SAG31_NODE_43821_length_265_cov_0.927711_1_plen_34_part_01